MLNISSINKKQNVMKKMLFISVLTLFFMSCEKDEFDLNNPDVQEFVQQIKNGTYINPTVSYRYFMKQHIVFLHV